MTTKRLEVITDTGSKYYLRRDVDGAWWCSADNVVTMRSMEIPGEWAIQEPVITLGKRMYLLPPAPLEFAYGHKDRMPGGGKITSVVRTVTELTTAE